MYCVFKTEEKIGCNSNEY